MWRKAVNRVFTLNALNSINLSLVLITVNTCILNTKNTWHQLLEMLCMLGLQMYVSQLIKLNLFGFSHCISLFVMLF